MTGKAIATQDRRETFEKGGGGGGSHSVKGFEERGQSSKANRKGKKNAHEGGRGGHDNMKIGYKIFLFNIKLLIDMQLDDEIDHGYLI